MANGARRLKAGSMLEKLYSVPSPPPPLPAGKLAGRVPWVGPGEGSVSMAIGAHRIAERSMLTTTPPPITPKPLQSQPRPLPYVELTTTPPPITPKPPPLPAQPTAQTNQRQNWERRGQSTNRRPSRQLLGGGEGKDTCHSLLSPRQPMKNVLLHRPTPNQMLVNNPVQHSLVHVMIPDAFRVDDDNRPA